MQPRGLPTLLTDLATTELTYAVMGSLDAAQWAAYADPRLASLYVDDAAAELLGLREVDSGANVLLRRLRRSCSTEAATSTA